MKTWENITRLMVGIIFVGLASTTNAQDAPGEVDGKAELLRRQVAYEKNLNEIHQSHEAKIAKLGTRYAEALDKLLAKVQQAGDLDKTLAVTDEIKRFGDKEGMSGKAPEMLEMKGLRFTYSERAAAYAADAANETISLVSKYDKTLDQLQKDLVRNGALDEAKAVRQERQKVLESATYRDAKRGITKTPEQIDLIASLAGDWRLTTSKWGFTIHPDGVVTSTKHKNDSIKLSSTIEVVDLEKRIVQMHPMRDKKGRKDGNLAIWKVAEDAKSMSGSGVNGGCKHPAERR